MAITIFPTNAQKKKREKVSFEQSPRQTLVYDNIAYLPVIRSVQYYPIGKENQLPVYNLGSSDQLQLTFDDLRGDVRNYYFGIEHCDKDWTPSRVNILDYVQGFNEDRIEDYSASKGTFQAYTRYSLKFPSANLKPKLAGNYILKVYEDADKQRLILSRRFYVLNNLVNITADIVPSLNVSKRLSNQKLNITLKTGLTIPNPQRDLSIVVMQNQRPDNLMTLQQPNFSGNNEFRYTHSETFDFEGNNEFRFVDLRSFRIASERIKNIQIDTTVHVRLYSDEDNSQDTYAATFDENGRFYLRNRDIDDQDTDGDYATVLFSLQTEQKIKGNIYLVGGFNSYLRQEENKLQYDDKTNLWEVSLRLKQGLYDYTYVWEDETGKVHSSTFSGSHFQTGNDYQILIYNRKIGTYWDELVGFGERSIHNRK